MTLSDCMDEATYRRTFPRVKVGCGRDYHRHAYSLRIYWARIGFDEEWTDGEIVYGRTFAIVFDPRALRNVFRIDRW